MKRSITLLSLFCFSIAIADSPGKKPMYESNISIKNTSRLGDYNFYWSVEGDSARVFSHDTSLTLPGSAGRPMNAILWAVNKKTNTSTDTLFFDNYYAPDYIITIDTVAANKLLYSRVTVANNNSNEEVDSSDKESGASSPGKRSRIMFLAGISLAALLVLVALFIRRKKATNS